MSNRQYDIRWKPSPNRKVGRRGKKIVAIVDHITAGAFPGCLSWMCNPVSKASAQYLITRLGQIYQLVKDEDTAYHAGLVQRPSWSLYDSTNPNYYTIGIEHEGFPQQPFPEEQYQATLWLHQQLIERWKIPIDKEHIIGHYRIDSVDRPNCPGPNFPWDRLFNDLRMGVIDVALEKWMVKGGQAAVKDLAEKGLLSNPEQWESEIKLAESVPAYLFWMMLNRIVEHRR